MNKKRTKNNLVRIKNLYKSFKVGTRHTNVLKDITLDINQGEFVIIFGPSGCGKSTLLHSIMGLERPDSGLVQFEGFDIWKIDADDRARVRKRGIGIMYQQQNWIKSLTVQENVAFASQLSGSDKDEALIKAKATLEIAHITNRANYITSELSAGEQQKAGFARAIVTEPKLIVADEPTGNLDVRSGEVLMELFKNLRESGVTVIMVTHNPEYLAVADKVVFMLDGRIQKITSSQDKKDIDAIYSKILDEKTKFLETEVDKNKIPIPLGNVKEEVAKRTIPQRLISMFSQISKFFIHVFIMLYLAILEWVLTITRKNKAPVHKARAKFSDLTRKLDKNKKTMISGRISAFELTEISFRNLISKKTRTYTTIFGISLGIGFIVFLLSLGYGVERLIITEITTEHNLNQVDIVPSTGSGIKLNKESISEIEKINGISNVYPIMSSARKASFLGANTDVVVYSVKEGYLKSTSSLLLSGEYIRDDDDKYELIINTDYLATIGINEEKIIGETLELEKPLISEEAVQDGEKAVQEEVKQKYTIVGVVEDLNPPVVYILINDEEVTDYSQAQVVLEDVDVVSQVRAEIEAKGYETTSVVDTIAQIEAVFNYIKIALTAIGLSAFVISLLGMVNTLTVSLLERTREIGLMKSIGMESDNIRSLFITESMLMGFAGGVLGVLIGGIGGVLSSLILSLISLSNGGSYVSVSYIPLLMVFLICVASSLFGYWTGIFPAKRAVAMAPLDALRYE